MQGNSAYYGYEENRRNDYIRDMLITGGIDARDQTRQGLSQNGKESGELDLLICENELPVTVIEALNLTCVNKRYIDKHIEKFLIMTQQVTGIIFYYLMLQWWTFQRFLRGIWLI